MSDPIEDSPLQPPTNLKQSMAVVTGGVAALVAASALTFVLLRKPATPPPAAVANDPLLLAGRAVYFDRCVSCHGQDGKGNGPIAKGLSGPPVGDLTDKTWKHGDRPEQVEGVVALGVLNTAMPGWGRILSPDDRRAVTAYVYYLAGRDVPPELRTGGTTSAQ